MGSIKKTQCPHPEKCGVTFHMTDKARERCRELDNVPSPKSGAGAAVATTAPTLHQDTDAELLEAIKKSPTFEVWNPNDPEVKNSMREGGSENVDTPQPQGDHEPIQPSYHPKEHRPAFEVDERLSNHLNEMRLAQLRDGRREFGRAGMPAAVNEHATMTRVCDPYEPLADHESRAKDARILTEWADEHPRHHKSDEVREYARLLGDDDACRQIHTYAQCRERASIEKEYEFQKKRLDRIEDELKNTLDTHGTDGQFTYKLGEDAEVLITPARRLNSRKLDQELTDTEKADLQRLSYDTRKVSNYLKDDPERFESVRDDATPRWKFVDPTAFKDK